LLARRVDIAVVTRSYLELFLERHPELQPGLLISERQDQVYHHQLLLRPKGTLALTDVAGLLGQLQASGELSRLLGRYRLALGDKASVQ
jgi:hypothetical protein